MVDQTRQNRLRLMPQRKGLMIRASRLHRTACTHQNQEHLDRPAGNSVVREDSSAFATVDENAELLKSLAGRTKSSHPPTEPHPMRLGQVSEAAAELAAQEARRESKAPISAEDVLQQYAAAPKLRTSRPPAAELAPMQPLPMRRSQTVGVSAVAMLTKPVIITTAPSTRPCIVRPSGTGSPASPRVWSTISRGIGAPLGCTDALCTGCKESTVPSTASSDGPKVPTAFAELSRRGIEGARGFAAGGPPPFRLKALAQWIHEVDTLASRRARRVAA